MKDVQETLAGVSTEQCMGQQEADNEWSRVAEQMSKSSRVPVCDYVEGFLSSGSLPHQSVRVVLSQLHIKKLKSQSSNIQI